MLTPESLEADVRAVVAAARGERERFLALPTGADFAALASAYDRIRRPLDAWNGRVSLFTAVHPERAVRDRAEVLEQEIAAFDTELSLDREVYERLDALDPAAAADPTAARLVERALRDFRRAGVDGDEPARARVRELRQELVEIGQQFARNIVAGRRELPVAEGHAGLAGLPADFLAAHPEADDGSVTLSTDPTDYLPVLLYAESDELRRRLVFEFQNRAWPENLAVLDRLLARRHELALLLGYPSWAQYITEDKMVGSADAARAFIERVLELAQPQVEAEYAELLEEKRRRTPGARTVGEHESRFLGEQVKRERFGFDSQSVRPYFAYERVKQGVLDVSAELFGVEFRRDREAAVWHESVECHEMLEGGEPIARLYLDMFPRDGKYKHAALFELRRGLRGEVLPEAALVCNFPRPGDGDPALLLHEQVTTFFHEFGHLLHHLFAGGGDYLRFSGIATEWDFVEVPSQMFEEWAWDHGVLATFARHHESGEPIPADLVERLRRGEEYGKGLGVAKQMFYALLSLSLYETDPEGLDTTRHLVELQGRTSPVPYTEGTHFQAAFGHLNDYSAIYYTYMWSLVIAKDLFSVFRENPMEPGAADRFRRRVLAPGGGRDAVDLVRDFLGREHRFEAWEAWLRR